MNTQIQGAGYEMVIGLEVHAELRTRTKLFCACPTAFGAPPNTNCCPVCAGMPGALPVLNEEAVRLGVIAGLVTGCRIAPLSGFDRKHYFYPDLPKGYQITQARVPLCSGGGLDIELPEGGARRVGITRIHLEEDAGKLTHVPGLGTLVDCNRCGVPLIEIVSGPDLRGAQEAKATLRKLRALLVCAGVSDGRMNEGSLRCDVNLSVRRRGETALGVRTELKNLSGFQNVGRAIEAEFARQVRLLEAGEAVERQTRRFDPKSGETALLRCKEDADDYRFFPEPDLPPVRVSDEMTGRLRRELPPLPDERKARYVSGCGLTPYAAEQLSARLAAADFFEAAAERTDYPALAANLILGDVFRRMGPEDERLPLSPEHLASLAQMLGAGEINSAVGREVMAWLWEHGGDPREYVQRQGLRQLSDSDALRDVARRVIAGQAKTVADYRRGKKAALQALVGQAMRLTGGKGNPVLLRELLEELLAK